MKKNILFLSTALFLILYNFSARAQGNLVLNDGYIVLENGTSTTPTYLVIDDTASTGIVRNNGAILSEDEFDYVKWDFGTAPTTHVIPFGYSTTDYIPLTVSKSSTGPASYAISTWNTDMQNNPHPVNVNTMGGTGDSVTSALDRFWGMEVGASMTADITYSYRAAENTINNPTSTITSQQYLGAWQGALAGGDPGTTSGVGTTTLTTNLDPGSYPMVLVNANQPLPVSFINFYLVWQNNEKRNSLVSWSAVEINSDKYIIHRSLDGENFEPIATVTAKGDNGENQYTYIDDLNNFSNQVFYYKIESIDVDEKSYFTSIERITRDVLAQNSVSIFPNPISNQININFAEIPETELKATLYNALGQAVLSEQINYPSKNEKIELPSAIAQGMYLLELHYNKTSKQFKLLKK